MCGREEDGDGGRGPCEGKRVPGHADGKGFLEGEVEVVLVLVG